MANRIHEEEDFRGQAAPVSGARVRPASPARSSASSTRTSRSNDRRTDPAISSWGRWFGPVVLALLIVTVVLLWNSGIFAEDPQVAANLEESAAKLEESEALPEVLRDRVESNADQQSGDMFMSPVSIESSFNEESAWLIAEPGVLLDNTATWDRGSSVAEHYVQCPEGGFAFVSAGHGTLNIGGYILELPGEVGRNHIVAIRCRIDDGRQDTDLNLTVTFSGYTPGNVITSPMPTGAYISAGWFQQQLEVSAGLNGQSGGNCGASGCSENWIHTHDVDSDFSQLFVVQKDNIDAWELRTIE